MEDGDHVHVVDHDFHRQQDDNEADEVHCCSLGRDAVGSIPALSDVIVERDDGPSEVEGRVHGIGEVIAESIVSRLGRYRDAVPL